MFGKFAGFDVAMLCFNSSHPSAERLNHDFIDDGQTVKKYINHAYCTVLARGYFERCPWLRSGGAACHPIGAILVCSKMNKSELAWCHSDLCDFSPFSSSPLQFFEAS